MLTLPEMKDNTASVRERIESAAKRSGRAAGDISLVAVSKFQPLEALYMALDCGITVFGENRVQERETKAAEWTERGAKWRMIGHLQRNKARKALELFDAIDSVDSFDLALYLDRVLIEKESPEPYPVMIEVNTSGEESKNGAAPDSAISLAEKIMSECPRLKFSGMMTIGPLVGGVSETRRSFALLRTLAEETCAKLGTDSPRLSMGMSGDFELAIEEGSTMVRVGTGIFGARQG
ncbi:YggS family pyridoxal phosphate enzyme [Synergistales bacterium]|nr:YggS family pyridoxal phosphate enzyme [Synergistales bacterium]GHV54714.1 YggS family pyridoxal phosphate enzyme [Synergistales bacterium]